MSKYLNCIGFLLFNINTQITLHANNVKTRNFVASSILIATNDINKRTYAKLDQLAIQLCQTTPNIFLGVLFPTAMELKLDQVRAIIRQNGVLFHEKIIHLCNKGFREFIGQLPTKTIRWWHGYFTHATRNKYPLHIFLFNCPAGVKQVLIFKEQIRKLYHPIPGILKDIKRTFHTTDTPGETVLVSQIVFNEHSLNFINHTTSFPTPNNFAILKQFIESNCEDKNLTLDPRILTNPLLEIIIKNITMNQLPFDKFYNSYASKINHQHKYFYYHGLRFFC